MAGIFLGFYNGGDCIFARAGLYPRPEWGRYCNIADVASLECHDAVWRMLCRSSSLVLGNYDRKFV